MLDKKIILGVYMAGWVGIIAPTEIFGACEDQYNRQSCLLGNNCVWVQEGFCNGPPQCDGITRDSCNPPCHWEEWEYCKDRD